MVLFETVDFVTMDYDWSLAEDDFLANFFSNGFACCCSSVNTGFCESTFL